MQGAYTDEKRTFQKAHIRSVKIPSLAFVETSEEETQWEVVTWI